MSSINLEPIRQMPGYEDFTEEDFVRIFGTPEALAAELRGLRADVEFIESECVRSEFAGKFVAVLDGEILGDAEDWHDLVHLGTRDDGRRPVVRRVPSR